MMTTRFSSHLSDHPSGLILWLLSPHPLLRFWQSQDSILSALILQSRDPYLPNYPVVSTIIPDFAIQWSPLSGALKFMPHWLLFILMLTVTKATSPQNGTTFLPV